MFAFALLTSVAFAVDDLWPELTLPKESTPSPKDVAIIVSIEDYAFVSDIPGANRNGQDWYRYFTETRQIPPDQIRWLKDTHGSKERIYTSALEITDMTSEEGSLWFVFVGHGAPSEDGADGFLVGVDAQQDAEGLYSRSISQEKVLSLLEAGKQQDTIAIIDACFSGSSKEGSLAPGLQPLIATADLNIGGTTVLSAGKSDQFAGPLPGADRPAFSYLALGAMLGWGDADGNGEVTTKEVQSYSLKALNSTLLGRQQTPQLFAQEEIVLGFGGQESPDFAMINLHMKDWEEARKLEMLRGEKRFSIRGNKMSLGSLAVSGVLFGVAGYYAYQTYDFNRQLIDLEESHKLEDSFNTEVNESYTNQSETLSQNHQKSWVKAGVTGSVATLGLGLGVYFAF